MQVQKNSDNITMVIVCCLHGDEIFGIDVFEYFKLYKEKYPYIKIILAHEEAIVKEKRFLEEDLNRCFGYDDESSYERKLTKQIMKEVRDIPYVLDIHTTSSDLVMTPIITTLDNNVIQLLSHISSKEIVYVIPPFGRHSLIAQVESGISLEFNEVYAKKGEALESIIDMVERMQYGDVKEKKERCIFYVDRVLLADIIIPNTAQNFEYCEDLGCYPFLLGEKNYTTHHGFGASKVERRLI